jgi:hypothetical protein
MSVRRAAPTLARESMRAMSSVTSPRSDVASAAQIVSRDDQKAARVSAFASGVSQKPPASSSAVRSPASASGTASAGERGTPLITTSCIRTRTSKLSGMGTKGIARRSTRMYAYDGNQ